MSVRSVARGLSRRLDPRHNPVVLKELRGRMRGARAFVVMTVYLLLLVVITTLIYFTMRRDYGPTSTLDRSEMGQALFFTVFLIQLAVACLLGPAFSVGAISGERERQTYEVLRTTMLSAGAFVFGKLLVALAYVLLLLAAAVPLMSFSFVLGGVAPLEVLVALCFLLVSVLGFVVLGLFCSALFRSPLVSSIAAYGTTLAWTGGGLAVLVLLAELLSDLCRRYGAPWPIGLVIDNSQYFIAPLNPLLAAVGTYYVWTDESSLALAQIGYGSRTLWVLSPWLPYFFFSLLGVAVMLGLSVWLVSRQERR